MMRSAVGQALGTTKPFTSVTVWIDRLSSNTYGEDDLEGIPELVEAINIQSTGPSEASRQLRKKLKYGSIHGQKRAITMLGAMVENCGPRFQTSFADPQLVERIKLSSQDPLIDASVRRKLMRMLLSWQNQFKNEPTMRHVASLYAACGGGRKSDAQMRSEAAEAFRKRKELEDRERQSRSDQKAAERLQREEDARLAKQRKKKGDKRTVFDFEKEKPLILSSLATSQQAATSLVNALQHVNREQESVLANVRVQQYLARVKTERKRVVRYIQLVRDEEFLGGLISANDQIILSLELYDKLSKTVADNDSDEESAEPLASIGGSKSATERVQERAEAEEAEIAIVQKRLADAHFEEGQLDVLQDKQRIRIERHNSYRSQVSGTSGSASAGPMRDLMDLSFDDDDASGSSRPPHAVMSPTSIAAGSTSSRGGAGASSSGRNATLSDYSDYESESDDEIAAVATAGTQAAGAQAGVAAATDASHPGDDYGRYSDNHRPSIGPESLYNYGGEDEDNELDPFADPFENDTPAPTSGSGAGLPRHVGTRQAFAAV